MQEITKQQWQAKHKDYKSIIDGQKYILTNKNGATVLAPVNIDAQ